jgi:CHAT domain-containing protein/tetratricopeptide (TPR) repeat protein
MDLGQDGPLKVPVAVTSALVFVYLWVRYWRTKDFIAKMGSRQAVDAGGWLANAGFVHQQRGELEQALGAYERAAAIAEAQDGISVAYAQYLGSIAQVHERGGDLTEARSYYERARDIAAAFDEGDLYAFFVNRIGAFYHRRGELERAIEYYQSAFEINEHFEYLSNIASVQLARGELESALDNQRLALRIAADHLQTCIDELSDYTDSQAHREPSDWEPQPRLFHHGTAVPLVPGFQQLLREFWFHTYKLGSVYHAMGRLDVALTSYEEALSETERIDDGSPSEQQAICNRSMGEVHREQGEHARALEFLESALLIAEEVAPRSEIIVGCLTSLSAVHRARGELDRAIADLERAVEAAESVRMRAGPGRVREQVFAQHQSPFREIIACLYARGHEGDHGRAFDYAERSRARGLVDMLSERRLDLRVDTAEQRKLLAEEGTLQRRLAATYNRLTEARQDPTADPEALVTLIEEEHDLETRLERLRGRIRREFPAYAALEYPEPLTASQVQDDLLSDTLLLAYDATGDEMFVWAIRSERLGMFRLGVAADWLEAKLDASIGAYQQGRPAPEGAARARAELAVALLGPVEAEFFSGVERLVVVPDGALHYLPFEILPHPFADGLLGERLPVGYAPSATTLETLRRLWRPDQRSGEFVGFGDPAFGGASDGDEGAAHRFGLRGRRLSRLPGTRDEVEAIAHGFGEGSLLYLDAEATERRVKAESEGFRFVHLATHGLLDDVNPLYSGLALAPPSAEERDQGFDDFLQVYELFSLKLSAELVVCSACQTGLGMIHAGEGLVGMSRALFFAGARCVIVSLWPVPDLPTAHLMARLYHELRADVPVARALQRARQHTRERYPDPVNWAAFVAVGEAW